MKEKSREQPFDENISDEDVNRILSLPVFVDVNPQEFPEYASLPSILKDHARIRNYATGDIVVREGDYGSSAFLVISGSARVVIEPGLPPSILGKRRPRKKNIFNALSRLWRRSRFSEVLDDKQNQLNAAVGIRRERGDEVVIFLENVEEIMMNHQTVELTRGDMFGEIAALIQTPRTSSVFARGDTRLVEIGWRGLRKIRRFSERFRGQVDALFRERVLGRQLRELPGFQNLPQEVLDETGKHARFISLGESGEQTADGSALPSGGGAILEKGGEVSDLIIVQSGYVKLLDAEGSEAGVVGYLKRGDSYGLEPIALRWRKGSGGLSPLTLKAQGAVDITFIPAAILERYVLPAIDEETINAILPADGGGAVRTSERSSLFEFLIDNEFVTGKAAMVIDQGRCTRCDDCVRACAATHGNNPRFLRDGKVIGNFMIAKACMHCVDPVCMIGCPTGAIHRNALGGQIIINDATCIGCSACADSCPFDAVKMVDARDEKGDFQINANTGSPVVKATNCDLCIDQVKGPVCQDACPHDALIRINLEDPVQLADWMER